jgi:hypothetical protein
MRNTHEYLVGKHQMSETTWGKNMERVVNKTPDNLTLEERDPDIHGRDGWALSADMDG